MTLRSRLILGLVTITVILVGPLVLGIQSLRELKRDANDLADKDFAASLVLGRLREGLSVVRHNELALLFRKDDQSGTEMDQQVRRVAAMADSLTRFDLPDYAKTIRATVNDVADAARAEFAAARAGDTTVADSISAKKFVPALDRADSVVRVAEHELQSRTADRAAAQVESIDNTEHASMLALALALAITACISIWLTRFISRPIRELQSGMRAVAEGDLDYQLEIPPKRSDEFGELARSFQAMTSQLNELDKLKAEFVSIASHELKTPINVIIGYLQLLEEGVYGDLTPQQRKIHKTIVAQANTLQRLVKQLLDISRFEAGGGRLELRDVQIATIRKDLENAFHVLALQREVRFCVEERPGVPEVVHWDVDRINEVLGNLLANAFKFTPHGGSVTLVIEPIEEGVRMQVRDTGAGIPPAQLPHIFEKFYQADNQGSARAAGSGLGLAIAKQIVDAHGGSITCESTVGVGTTFTITLPVQAAKTSLHQREQLTGAA
jgi:two-component system sensor histidine kinase BaeS